MISRTVAFDLTNTGNSLLSCPADQIPEELVVDLLKLEIGDTVRVGDLQLPKGIEAAIDADTVIVTLQGQSAQSMEDEEADATAGEEAAAEAAAEGEAAAAEEGGEEA